MRSLLSIPERPHAAALGRLATASLLVALAVSTADASIIAPPTAPADIERILAHLKPGAGDLDVTPCGAQSAAAPATQHSHPSSEGDGFQLLLTRTLSHPDGNMGASPSSSTGGSPTAPAALASEAASLAHDPLSGRLAAEPSAFLPDPPLEGALRPPQTLTDV
jgi:hypothetical protein